MKRNFRRNLIAGVSVAALVISVPALAAEKNYQQSERADARAYAHMMTEAYAAMELYIRRASSEAVQWGPGDIPPSESGWKEAWSRQGLRARYCDNSLLVYAGIDKIKGVEGDWRQIQEAAHDEITPSGARAPRLDWIVSPSKIKAGDGKELQIPKCLIDGYSKPLPSGRVAIFGPVVDPSNQLVDLAKWITETNACPAGTHGDGVSRRRQEVQTVDGRGNEVSKSLGNWEEVFNACHEDYAYWDYFEGACSWQAGPPFNKKMHGISTYRIRASVTSDGVKYGTPVFVSSTCFDNAADKPADIPEPTTNAANSTQTETKTQGCGSGYSGSMSLRRTRSVTTKTITFPWDQSPITAVKYGNWSAWAVTNSNCYAVNGNGGGSDGSYVDTDGDGFGDTPSSQVGPNDPNYGTSGGYGEPSRPGGGPSNQNQGGGNGSSGRVICTELYYQALMTRKDWAMDCQHAARYLSRHTVNGYQWWAKWAVLSQMRDKNGMPRTDFAGRMATRFWKYLAQRRANEIRHVLKTKNPRKYAWIEGGERPDWIGRAIRITLEPMCWCIGHVVGKQDVSHVHSNPYRQVASAVVSKMANAFFGYGWQTAEPRKLG